MICKGIAKKIIKNPILLFAVFYFAQISENSATVSLFEKTIKRGDGSKAGFQNSVYNGSIRFLQLLYYIISSGHVYVIGKVAAEVFVEQLGKVIFVILKVLRKNVQR